MTHDVTQLVMESRRLQLEIYDRLRQLEEVTVAMIPKQKPRKKSTDWRKFLDDALAGGKVKK